MNSEQNSLNVSLTLLLRLHVSVAGRTSFTGVHTVDEGLFPDIGVEVAWGSLASRGYSSGKDVSSKYDTDTAFLHNLFFTSFIKSARLK